MNCNWTVVLEYTAKAIIAAITGVSVYFGINSSLEYYKAKKRAAELDALTNLVANGGINGSNNQQMPVAQSQEITTGDVISKSIRSTGDTCSKLSGFMNSLSMMIECISKIFNPQPIDVPTYGGMYNCGYDGYNYGRPDGFGRYDYSVINPNNGSRVYVSGSPFSGPYNNYGR